MKCSAAHEAPNDHTPRTDTHNGRNKGSVGIDETIHNEWEEEGKTRRGMFKINMFNGRQRGRRGREENPGN